MRTHLVRRAIQHFHVWGRDGLDMATADLGEDSRDVGTGNTAQEAVQAALGALGEPYASEMAAGVGEDRLAK